MKHLDAGIAVYDGRNFIGTVVPRNSDAFEGFDAEASSLGLFDDEDEAATAVWLAAHKQEPRS